MSVDGWSHEGKLTGEAKVRMIARQSKWRKVERVRRKMSDEDHQVENARLIKEAAELASELGLSVDRIGEGWSRDQISIDLNTDGVAENARIRESVKKEVSPNYAELL